MSEPTYRVVVNDRVLFDADFGTRADAFIIILKGVLDEVIGMNDLVTVYSVMDNHLYLPIIAVAGRDVGDQVGDAVFPKSLYDKEFSEGITERRYYYQWLEDKVREATEDTGSGLDGDEMISIGNNRWSYTGTIEEARIIVSSVRGAFRKSGVSMPETVRDLIDAMAIACDIDQNAGKVNKRSPSA